MAEVICTVEDVARTFGRRAVLGAPLRGSLLYGGVFLLLALLVYRARMPRPAGQRLKRR